MLTDGLGQDRLQISGWLVTETRDTPYDGSTETPNPLSERTSVRVWLVSADVRLTARFGLQVTSTLPDVTRSAVVNRPTGVVNFSETFRGFGDTSVLFWHRGQLQHWGVVLNGGVSLPTGKTEAPRFSSELDEGSLVPLSRLQRGSGTVDPLVGITANRLISSIFHPGVRVFANAATRVPLATNEHGLRTGASWEVGTGASREILRDWFVVMGRLSWLHRKQDTFNGTPILVGGGDWIYFAPALSITRGPVTFQTEAKFPLHRSLDNRQLDAARAFQVGMIWKPF